MYANEAKVRNLCRNKKSALSPEEIAAAAEIADVEIDLALSQRFYWPTSSAGAVLNNPAPAQIAAIANLLTAATIEMQAFAQNEAGAAIANPYGRSLERKGRAILDGLCSGSLKVPFLEEASNIASAAAKPVYCPVRGLRGGIR